MQYYFFPILFFKATLNFNIDHLGRKVSKESKDLLEGLLNVNCNERLGSSMAGNLTTAADDIRNHKFFEEIDFDELRSYNIESPFCPTVF